MPKIPVPNKQGQKLSIKTEVTVVIRSEGVKERKLQISQ